MKRIVLFVLTNLAVMLVLNVANIAVRGITDKGIVWVFPWTMVIFVWMTFFGFFVLYRQRRDISVDFLVDRLGSWASLASRLVINALIVALMAVMLANAPRILEQQVGNIEMVGLERYTMSVPLFVSCALILVTFIVDTVHALAGRPEPRHHLPGEALRDAAP